MDGHRQPEGASRQAVGVLMGALVGCAIAARLIFDNYAGAGRVPWADGLLIIIAGCVVGLVLATLFGAAQPRGKSRPPIPAGVESIAREHFAPPKKGSDPHVRPHGRISAGGPP